MNNNVGVGASRDDLIRAYVTEQRSLEEIGYDLGCDTKTVIKMLSAFNIEIRTKESMKRHKEKLTKEFLQIEYINNKKTALDIAIQLGCSYNAVNKALKESGLSIRTPNVVDHKNLTGNTFGKWKVLYQKDIKKQNGAITAYLCKCVCGRTKRLTPSTLISGASTQCSFCEISSLSASSIPSTYINSLKHAALLRGIKFLVTVEYLEALYEKQNRRCALTGARLNMCEANQNIAEMTASVDRIDSMGIYEEGNVQWVHKIVNTMKWDLSQQDFINICHEVAARNPKQGNNILIEGNIESENDEHVSAWELPSMFYKFQTTSI